MIKVPDEWLPLANKLLSHLNLLKINKDYETLEVLWIVEKDGHLKVAYRLEPDVDELYEVIMNIIKDYEKRMQTAISFNKTSNIQGRTGGSSTAFWFIDSLYKLKGPIGPFFIFRISTAVVAIAL